METRVIITAMIKYKNKYLIAKRSSEKKFAPNQWEFISGFVDTNETSETIILRELKEELNIQGKIMKYGNPYVIKDKDGRWIILPYLIKVNDEKFRINKKDRLIYRVKEKTIEIVSIIGHYE